MSMSEAIVIQAVYVAIGPFFVVEGGTDSKGKEKKSSALSATLGTSAMRGLRLEALGLICSVSKFVNSICAELILKPVDFCKLRGTERMDYRRDLVVAHQTFRYQTEGWAVQVRLGWLLTGLS